jgi:hypothetical protein
MILFAVVVVVLLLLLFDQVLKPNLEKFVFVRVAKNYGRFILPTE